MDDILNIAICEDDALSAERLLAILAEAPTPNRCSLFHSAEELLAEYAPEKFDLLLMDIYMGGMTGVEAVTRIRKLDPDVAVSFITSSPDFALESYRLSAIGYVEKPFQRDAIYRVLQQAEQILCGAPSLTVRQEARDHKIRLSRILFMETRSHQLKICQTGGEVLFVREKLSDLLPYLEGQPFYHCHKSFCVNLSHVSYIDKELRCFVMTDGSNVPIRRAAAKEAQEKFENHLLRNLR